MSEDCTADTTHDPSGLIPAADDAEFQKEIASIINRYGRENASQTPDYILAKYVATCIDAYDAAVLYRAKWYGRIDIPGRGSVPIFHEDD